MAACERVKILQYGEGMYVLSSSEDTRPCRYLVRWCPKAGHVVQIANDAPAAVAMRSIREHHALGDTIDHLLAMELD
jgi:hypothetical protein